MTDFLIRTISSSNMPSLEDTDDSDVAFKVLNNDNLPFSIIGEGILKPFGTESQKQKPNVVVYPTRRVVTQLEENKDKAFTKSSGFIDRPPEKLLKKNYSNSHGNLNHCNSATKTRVDDIQNHAVEKVFSKTLDAKLKKLQKDERHRGRKPQDRPLFITTVKKGQFLQPPPEVSGLFGGFKVEEQICKDEKKMYAFASKPRVLNKQNHILKLGHKTRCEAAAKAAAAIASTIAGVKSTDDTKKEFDISKKLGDVPLPYANLMFERRVARGSNYAMPPHIEMPKWNPNFAHAKLLSQTEGAGESVAARAAAARRRAMARRKAQAQQLRGAQLRLASPPPIQGRKHEPVQTEDYLEELLNNPPMADMTTQTDLFLDRPRSPLYVSAKSGIDVETQIYPGDLFDFDMEVQPILEVLVGKTVEQALIEVLEEEELAALRVQQRHFVEIRAGERAELQRLETKERRWQVERSRRMAEYEEGTQIQKVMEERIAAAVLMQGYMADLLPSVLEGLEEDGYLTDYIKQDLDESFMPWLMREVTEELQEMVSSRDVLTDLVREILESRAALYRALYESKPEEAEEEGPTGDIDIDLAEHLKLKQELEEQKREESNGKAE